MTPTDPSFLPADAEGALVDISAQAATTAHGVGALMKHLRSRAR
ncbi:hypothetical protein [Pelomonas sp. Root1237]|nr:hypothetical protein [Pelomonas sp. Root1237]